MRSSLPSFRPMAGSPLTSWMALKRANSSSVVSQILAWSKRQSGSPAWPSTAARGTPNSSRRIASVPETRKRSVMVSAQRCHVDHEAVLHVAFEEARICLGDLLDRDLLDIGGDALLATEVQHFLSFANAADAGSGEAA